MWEDDYSDEGEGEDEDSNRAGESSDLRSTIGYCCLLHNRVQKQRTEI